ncbi:MAG: molybdopterin-dependent oxidoreductase [Deltaproteobacteria bacterium]|nr:molybdopterin-dependent oxidoreductase [Deltaproteobacteria bacterium]
MVLDQEPGSTLDPITSNEDFYVYSCCGGADPDPATWSLEILDRDVSMGRIDVAWLADHEALEFEHTLQCIGSGPRNLAISNAIFGGMRLTDVFAELGVTVDPSIVQLYLVGEDDYDAGMPAADIEKAWLVWEMNGVPLPVEHGFPARLLIPGRYGVKNVKWVRTLALHSEAVVDYWTERSWDADAPYKVNGFILAPVFGAEAAVGSSVAFVGVAYAGEDPVTSVEITFDGFQTTSPCQLDYAPGANRWVQWSFEWTPQEAGTVTAQLRVRTAGGAVSSENPNGTEPLAGYDGGMAVDIVVG